MREGERRTTKGLEGLRRVGRLTVSLMAPFLLTSTTFSPCDLAEDWISAEASNGYRVVTVSSDRVRAVRCVCGYTRHIP